MTTRGHNKKSGRVKEVIHDPELQMYARTHWNEWDYYKDGMRDTPYLEWKERDKKKSKIKVKKNDNIQSK